MTNTDNPNDNSRPGKPADMISNLMGYIDTRIDLIRLDIQNKMKAGFVGILHAIMLGFTAFMALIFLNIFLGLMLNDLLDSQFWGFGILTAFYIVLFLIFFFGLDKKTFQGVADKTFENTIYKNDKTAK
ncbi:phage holin family protein [Adhaeribacter sp. BT258]|uniref:Phage holin family protein n=1 Tax=Adhaeribacter terrigena TaxID=2793070 RepID=A0ABS1C267_9BACT|nr:phage holin family protein [Adhaeribacter terrigena]MBK0403486.1 phage holin family protein [Adhaeribacter terrigena]